jgi:hypothetical protein
MKRPGVLLIMLLLLSAVVPESPLQAGAQGVRHKDIGINSNDGDAGFSYDEKLSSQVLSSEERREAEFVGTTVIYTGQTLHLQSVWKARGGDIDSVAHSFVWKLDGVTYGTDADLVVNDLSPGDYALELTHLDSLNRNYAYHGRVQVLEPTAYAQLVASVAAANQVLFSTGSGGDTVYLPIVSR